METTVSAGPGRWVLPVPRLRPPLTLNSRMHHMVRWREETALKNEMRYVIRHARVPRLAACMVELTWYPGRNGVFDADNIAPTLKPCQDALVLAGILPDDRSDRVLRASLRVVARKDDPTGSRSARLHFIVTDCSVLAPPEETP